MLHILRLFSRRKNEEESGKNEEESGKNEEESGKNGENNAIAVITINEHFAPTLWDVGNLCIFIVSVSFISAILISFI